jgi:hypothetical protein
MELSQFGGATYLRGTEFQAKSGMIGKPREQYLHRPMA